MIRKEYQDYIPSKQLSADKIGDDLQSGSSMAMSLLSQGWKFVVKAYYNEKKKPEWLNGKIAFITKHKTKFSKDIEVEAAQGREDIGKVDIIYLEEKVDER